MKQTIEGLQVDNKTVFVRVDFNVPMKDGVITDDTRIRSALPTINYLIEKGAKVILASHFGRPKGERKPEMSLAPCAKHLSELINKPVAFVDDCIGPKVEAAVKALQPEKPKNNDNNRNRNNNGQRRNNDNRNNNRNNGGRQNENHNNGSRNNGSRRNS